MAKKKKEKQGPSGMVKRCLGKGKLGPDKPPPAIGSVVWYMDSKEAWRTGRLLRVIDRGRHWGKLEVRDSVSGGLRKVVAEQVKAL